MDRINLIDFRNSFITWYHREQDTYGRFAIEAICKVRNNNGERVYYLLSSVMAGNVYSKANLFKIPPYKFTAVLSENEYKIFREFLFNEKTTDSFGDSIDILTNLISDIKTTIAEEISSVQALREKTLKGYSIIVSVTPCFNEIDERFEIVFPAKHINLRGKVEEFQIESGPIILPKLGYKKNIDVSIFELAFINFNTFKQAYFAILSLNEVFFRKSVKYLRFFDDIQVFNSEIKIYSC